MKKLGLLGIIVTVFSLMTSSCSNIVENTQYVQQIRANRRTVTITVTSDSNLINFSSSELQSIASRTITPNAIQSTDLNFYIGGTDLLYNSKLPVQKVNFSATNGDTNKGIISLELDASNYKLTLVAVNKVNDNIELTSETAIEDLIPDAVLVGYTNADLIYSDSITTIAFYLTSEGLSGNGNFNFSFYLKDWSTQSLTARRGDYNCKTTDRVEASLRKNGIAKDSTILSFTNILTASDAISYSGSLPSGTYDLVLTFTQGLNIFTYTENIKILSGQNTNSLFAISDIIMNPPAPPTDFKVGYITPTSTSSDFYYVLFNWTDNSNTEDCFEIEIQDECDNTANVTPSTIIDQTAWDTQISSYTKSYSTDFYRSSNWYAGDLNKNSTWVAFYMPLGKRYIARIRSVNDAGGSEWCYASTGNTTATVKSGSSTAEESNLVYSKALNGKAFSSSIINLYSIKYNLNGGAFDTSIPNVYYFDQTTTGTPIMIPDGISTIAEYNSGNTISLNKNTDVWSKWKIGYIGGSDLDTSSNYMNYTNLNLYAIYEAQSPAATPTDYSIAANLNFSVTSSGTGTQPALSITSDTVTVTKTGGDYTITRLDIGYTYLSTARYSSVSLELSDSSNNDVGSFQNNGNKISIPLTSYTADTYTALIKAYAPDNPVTPNTYTLTIIIQ